MREFKVGDEVQATRMCFPSWVAGLTGQIRAEKDRHNMFKVCFPESRDHILYKPPGFETNEWPMFADELILITAVEDAQP